MTPGVESGGIPRRSLAVVAALTGSYFTIMVSQGLPLAAFILIHTSSMVAIYTLGMIAAVRLLATWSLGWWLAVVSVALTAGLLVLAGPNLVVPALLAVVALIVRAAKRHRLRPSLTKEPL